MKLFVVIGLLSLASVAVAQEQAGPPAPGGDLRLEASAPEVSPVDAHHGDRVAAHLTVWPGLAVFTGGVIVGLADGTDRPALLGSLLGTGGALVVAGTICAVHRSWASYTGQIRVGDTTWDNQAYRAAR